MRSIKTTVEFVSNVIDEFENEIELKEVIISEYDENGKLTLQNIFHDENLEVLQSITLYKYDNNGALIETLTLNKNEEPVYKINYWYNELLLLEAKECFDLITNSKDRSEIFKYDNQKSLIESYDIVTKTKKTYEYEAKGQVKRIFIFSDNSNEFTKVLSYSYNENNDVDSALTTNHYGQPIHLETIVYEYDNDGNWVICHRSSDDKNVFSERKITYRTEYFDFIRLGFKLADINKLKEGDFVLHHRFGHGKIIKLKGKHPNIFCAIKFDNYGEKELYLQYAKLGINENNNA
jgi:hypothetical protein